MNKRTQKTMFSSKDHNWQTPIDLFKKLNEEFNFRLDACTDESNLLHTPEYYTIDDNGLERDWFTWTFCNPPFKDVSKWVAKALHENAMRGIGSVLLLPARTDTKWFNMIWNRGKQRPHIYRQVRFLEGRLKFGNGLNSAPFPSMIVVFATRESWRCYYHWNNSK